MKLIDEKGKLFEKVNVIDFIIVVMILGVIAAGVYKLVLDRDTGSVAEVVTGDIVLTIKARLQPEEVVDQLKVGDKLVARGAYQEAEIVSIEAMPAAWVAWTADGKPVDTTHPFWRDIVVVIKDKGDSKAPIVRVGGQEARTGKEFILKTQNVEVPAIAYNIEFQ